LAQLGLADRIDHYPDQLSGGQKQRVAIARALINNPRVILADEPTGNLDSATSHTVMTVLTEINRQGRTLIMVTHEDDIAARTQRIIRLKDGRMLGCLLSTSGKKSSRACSGTSYGPR
jgi:ABC-type lipoprotein export system ATPase subunit